METTEANNNEAFSKGRRLEFGEFAVDADNRVLLHSGKEVPLTGKVFDVLLVLVQSPGRLLSKNELIERVWPKEFVEEGNLARNVSTLRKALGDTGKEHKYIATVQGRGYRFIGDLSQDAFVPTSEAPGPVTDQELINQKRATRRWVMIATTAVILLTVALMLSQRFLGPVQPVTSLAVLPLKRLDNDNNYLGIGIADAVIRQLSQTRQLTVRPTSAVLRYAKQDTDALVAAKELNADAVLDGTVQQSGDRVRVSVNLFRTADGRSVWSDRFEMQAADVFRIEDEVARKVAERLQVRLNNGSAAIIAGSPVDPIAYDWYVKGLFSLDQRGFGRSDLGHMLDTVDYFKHAVEADPNFAIAHGELAFSYAWLAMFVDPGETKWADLARQEIARSLELDPNIAEPHVANALLYWSIYGGHQIESAIRELRLAKQLDPNYSGGDLAALYAHVGLEQQAVNELHRVTSIDPTSIALKGLNGILPYLRGDVDGWVAAAPNVPLEDRPLSRWYYMHKGSLDLAQRVLDKQAAESPDNEDLWTQRAILTALSGDFAKAEAKIPGVLSRIQRNSESYHHRTFDAACVYALAGNSTEAVKWLRETVNTGFPNYPLFMREPFLDRIRQSSEFIQFMTEQKARFERNQQEFGE